ncbi:MAG: nucleotide exchange factor GrpE [Chloroflexota bacterium]|nr:nucleotide exchange factor GrpE [Chloroflexota bacterium]
MTQRTRGQERADAADITPTKLLAEIEALKADNEAARGQADEYLGLLQRERAEFANYRRRTAEERERELGLAGEDLIRKVLAIADDFDLAIDHVPPEIASNPWVSGVVAIDRKLRSLLESEGVTQIDASQGRPFDPREHEAIAQVPAPGQRDGEIVEEIRRGYRLRDRVIRPALVAVAQGSGSGAGPGEAASPQDSTTEPTDQSND